MVAFPNPRRRHPFHMHDMILGQPAFVAEALRRTAAADVSSFLGTPRRLVLTGCGTSFHAATYAARVRSRVQLIRSFERNRTRCESQRLHADDEPGPSPRPGPGLSHDRGVRTPGFCHGTCGRRDPGHRLDPRPFVGEHDELYDAARRACRRRLAVEIARPA